MSAPVFAAAQQTSRMINRETSLAQLKQAICDPGEDTRVVIIEAVGGLGKTRLLSEALWRAGNPNVFSPRGAPLPGEAWTVGIIASDLLDFTEVRLQAKKDFIERLREAFNWHPEAVFLNYDAARSAYRRRRKDQVDYNAIKTAEASADEAFFKDYQAIAQSCRLVWGLDTAEQLSYSGAPWLREMLTANDFNFSTREQILRSLRTGQLPNTTILLAGRPSARDFYNELKQAAPGHFRLTEIKLDVFKPGDTALYLKQLATDYRTYAAQPGYDPNIAEALMAIAHTEDRIQVLHQYTGGRPVLLALFTDVLAEGKEEPAPLQDKPEEAKARLKESTLEQVQFEIEEAFINLIFAKTGDIRSRILAALVRARRGLDLPRLHFVLGSKPGEAIETWQGDPTLQREIEQALAVDNPQSLRHLSFVKRGFGERLILQDELYRIYDKHMAQEAIARQDESQARFVLYRQLQLFAEANIAQLKQERRQNRVEDEASLRWESPARALSRTFRYLGREEEDRRIELEEQLFEAELERLHYKLRLDPEGGINDAYLDLAEKYGRAGDLNADVLAQVEVWRFILYDEQEEYWRAFIDLRPEIWRLIELIVTADEATRWIKRFWLRKSHQRGVEFADQVEQVIQNQSEPLRNTLNNPVIQSERVCWKEICQTYLSQDILGNIKTLQRLAVAMEQLLASGFPQNNEFGLQPQAVANRLQRVIGYIYNNMGYSYTTLGYYREANQSYTECLRYFRDIVFPTNEAIARNNLSRVLSELGVISQAVRVCRDALALREEVGYENPIAVSHSTLALIYNNGLQPENAWFEAAKAVAYFRKLEDERGLGLALHHLGEALRRLATFSTWRLDSPEQLFETANEAISEAVRLFDGLNEPMRRIEVGIEQGCLFRNYMYYLKRRSRVQPNSQPDRRVKQYRDRAVNTLKRALGLAQELGFPRHQLDALVDLAWAYYYAQETELAEQTFRDSLKLACKLADNDQDCFLREGTDPPTPNQAEPYIFMLLGKAWSVRGRMCMDQFVQQQEKIKEEILDKQARIAAVHNDPATQEALQAAAEAFVLALAYNKLYSARSPYTSVVFDTLYDFLKKFNRTELHDFYSYQRLAKEKYKVTQIEPVDLTDMEIFLKQSFGDHLTPLPGVQEVV